MSSGLSWAAAGRGQQCRTSSQHQQTDTGQDARAASGAGQLHAL
jgi:hypothetical protein